MVATPQGTINRRPLNAAVKPCGLHLLLLLFSFRFALAVLKYRVCAHIRAGCSRNRTRGGAANRDKDAALNISTFGKSQLGIQRISAHDLS
jgi:hypothetical protein